MAQAGKSVLVCEAADTIGGGARTDELTLPGFRHDVCSSIFPLAAGSPFFTTLPLERLGVEWVHPPAPMAHPFDDGSTFDMAERIENQVERFAPGFRDLMLRRSVRTPDQLQEYNPNCLGGDINGGVQDLWQLFTRPAVRPVPYSTPARGLYICSSWAPPGGGAHGMCGYHAAQAALRALF